MKKVTFVGRFIALLLLILMFAVLLDEAAYGLTDTDLLDKFNNVNILERQNLMEDIKSLVRHEDTTIKEEDPEAQEKAEKMQTCYTTDDVNMREEPNTHCDVLTVVEKSATVERIMSSEPSDWSLVKYENKYGYIKEDYLSKDKPKKEEVASSTLDADNLLGIYQLTAYCNCAYCCGTAGNLTASGTYPTEGRTVAINGVALGTHILIEGKEYIVEDTGAMGYGVVDIYFEDHTTAENFGRKFDVPVYVIK